MRFSITDKFADVIRRVLANAETRISSKGLAEQLGVHPRSLTFWISGDLPDRRFPAELVPQFCKILGNFDALDYLERQAGRLAFEIPPVEPVANEELRHAFKLSLEAHQAAESLLKALDDSIIDEREIQETIGELDDVIRQCMRIRYWLERQEGRRRKPG